jgi:RHS repeat-associated protein
VHEHVEYYPYGEVWWEPRYDADGGPVKGQQFLFSSKELDEETGLYYFGARYYDPKQARWKSADPILGQYLDGQRGVGGKLEAGGVFRPVNLSLYHYAGHNPLSRVDHTGEDDVYFTAAGDVAKTVKSKTEDVYLHKSNNTDALVSTRSTFNKVAATVYAEVTPGNGEEAKGIAGVISNRGAYTKKSVEKVVSDKANRIEGYGNARYKKGLGALEKIEKGKSLDKNFGFGEREALQAAIAGTLHAMSGGEDVTKGAFFWGHSASYFDGPAFEQTTEIGKAQFYKYAPEWQKENQHPKSFP